MPKKGDDFDLITATAAVEHCGNTIGLFTPVKYSHPSTRSEHISIIFDMAFLEIGNVSGYRPTAVGSSADFDRYHIGVGSHATIKNVHYTITEKEPDGTGLTMMIMQRV